jgi:hypothetical protein
VELSARTVRVRVGVRVRELGLGLGLGRLDLLEVLARLESVRGVWVLCCYLNLVILSIREF